MYFIDIYFSNYVLCDKGVGGNGELQIPSVQLTAQRGKSQSKTRSSASERQQPIITRVVCQRPIIGDVAREGGGTFCVGRALTCSMADDGDGRSVVADTSGGQGTTTTEELDPGPGLGGMLLNFALLILFLAACYGVYRRWFRRSGADADRGDEASALPKMGRRDFTLEQLREYDGVQNPRILMAVNMKVFDVTSGKKFYGRGKSSRYQLGAILPAKMLPSAKIGAMYTTSALHSARTPLFRRPCSALSEGAAWGL